MKPRKTSGDDCREVFAGLVFDEMLELTAVAGVIVKGTVVSSLFLEFLGANKPGECQLLLPLANTGDEVAAGAMMRGRPAPAAGSLGVVPQ